MSNRRAMTVIHFAAGVAALIVAMIGFYTDWANPAALSAAILLSWPMMWAWGWLRGNAAATEFDRDEAYAEGWRDACADQDEGWPPGGHYIG